MNTHLHPTFIQKNRGLQGYTLFFIFCSKHRLWVLVRTASARRFKRVPTIYVLSKIRKNIKNFHLNIIICTAVRYCSILHGHICVMENHNRNTVFSGKVLLNPNQYSAKILTVLSDKDNGIPMKTFSSRRQSRYIDENYIHLQDHSFYVAVQKTSQRLLHNFI